MLLLVSVTISTILFYVFDYSLLVMNINCVLTRLWFFVSYAMLIVINVQNISLYTC